MAKICYGRLFAHGGLMDLLYLVFFLIVLLSLPQKSYHCKSATGIEIAVGGIS